MKRFFVLLALCTSITIPLAASAQMRPGMGGPPTAEQRAALEKVRTDAKVAAYNALTPAHRDRVAAIIADVVSGKQTPRVAAQLIDSVLTPDEQKGVQAAAATSFRAMRTAMGGAPPPGPPPAAQGLPGGPAAQGAPPPRPGGMMRRTPSAGRFLLMVSLTRDQMRSLEPRARSTSAP